MTIAANIETTSRAKRFGYLSAVGAYLSWGLLPLYWKQLTHFTPLVILAHRMIWSFVFISLVLVFSRSVQQLSLRRHSPQMLLRYVFSACLISVNWLIYIWAVNNGHVLQASLGYFLNPLVNVILGNLFFKEKLVFAQKIAIGFALAGVLLLLTQVQSRLWISGLLACTFSFYGVVRKKAVLSSLEGMYLETFAMLPVGLVYLIFSSRELVNFFNASALEQGLLVGSGIITALPLLFFSNAAKQLTMSTLGMFQYISPTLQLLLAIFVYHEVFTHMHVVSFALIWTGLGMYTFTLLARLKKSSQIVLCLVALLTHSCKPTGQNSESEQTNEAVPIAVENNFLTKVSISRTDATGKTQSDFCSGIIVSEAGVLASSSCFEKNEKKVFVRVENKPTVYADSIVFPLEDRAGSDQKELVFLFFKNPLVLREKSEGMPTLGVIRTLDQNMSLQPEEIIDIRKYDNLIRCASQNALASIMPTSVLEADCRVMNVYGLETP